MDLESLHYFAELTKDLNMTQTAKRLYLSQQTLSNHIARLERYCGTALFYRKPRLSLTPAGLALLHFSSSILSQEKEFKEILSDLIDESSGIIRFEPVLCDTTICYLPFCPLFPKKISPGFSSAYR